MIEATVIPADLVDKSQAKAQEISTQPGFAARK